jgi:hypothetical protein
MHTIDINGALSCGQEMLHPIVDGVEESLSIERTAFEYDCKLHHLFLLKTDATNDVNLYTPTVNPGFPILYSNILKI